MSINTAPGPSGLTAPPPAQELCSLMPYSPTLSQETGVSLTSCYSREVNTGQCPWKVGFPIRGCSWKRRGQGGKEGLPFSISSGPQSLAESSVSCSALFDPNWASGNEQLFTHLPAVLPILLYPCLHLPTCHPLVLPYLHSAPVPSFHVSVLFTHPPCVC